MPAKLILHPAKFATPAVAASGFVVQLSVPLLGFVLIARVIDAVLPVPVVTGLPNWSSTVTTGCCDQATPPVPPPGWVVKTNCVAVLGVILKVLLVAPVKPVLEAASV